jgi:hypothetical protein
MAVLTQGILPIFVLRNGGIFGRSVGGGGTLKHTH